MEPILQRFAELRFEGESLQRLLIVRGELELPAAGRLGLVGFPQVCEIVDSYSNDASIQFSLAPCKRWKIWCHALPRNSVHFSKYFLQIRQLTELSIVGGAIKHQDVLSVLR